MKWRVHRRITREVCKFLNIPRDLADDIVESITLPDENPEYITYYKRGRIRRKRVAHHSPEALLMAWKHLKKARRKLLRGEDCSTELGMALHYIQDYAVDPTKKFFIFVWRSDKAHDEREKELENIPIPAEAMIEGVKIRKINEFKKALFSAKPHREPNKAMWEAVRLTAAALEVVFNPEREGYDWTKALLIHLALVASPFLLLLVNPGLLFFSIVASYILHRLDFHYHRAKLERDWFKA